MAGLSAAAVAGSCRVRAGDGTIRRTTRHKGEGGGGNDGESNRGAVHNVSLWEIGLRGEIP